jgi:CRP/FNR family transcriptional regulator
MGPQYHAKFTETSNGDHIIIIYRDPADLLGFVVPFIKEGFTKGERVLYVLDDLTIRELTDALTAGGVNVSRETERGALVLTNGQEYARLPLDPMRVLELTREKIRDPLSGGFSGRFVAEMTWALKTNGRDRTLVEYEALLDDALSLGKATVVCAYRSGRFPTTVLQHLIRTHAKIVAGDEVYLTLSGIFQEVSQADLQTLMASAQERRVPKDGFFFQQGDPSTEVFVLTSGRIKMVRSDSDGRSVILRLVTPPKPFGHITGLAEIPRHASAQALEDSRALAWDVPTVLKIITARPDVSINVVRYMAKQIAAGTDRLVDLATSPVERRLARLLHRLSGSLGRSTPEGVVIELGLSGEELAELLNTTPYTISRILAEWRRLHLVAVQRDRILLFDDTRLGAIAGESHSAETPSR